MAKSKVSSLMASEQADKAGQIAARTLRADRKSFEKEPVQKALVHPQYSVNFKKWFAEQVKILGNYITTTVTGIDRNKTPEEKINATGRRQFVNSEVLKSMPKSLGGDSAKLEWHCPGKYLTPDELEKWFEEMGIKPDFDAQIKANADDPAWADTHPNGMQWKNEKGEWCYATFSRFDLERSVDVRRGGGRGG